jgi:hypothetical protein
MNKDVDARHKAGHDGIRLRQKSNFANPINAESTVQPLASKYFT